MTVRAASCGPAPAWGHGTAQKFTTSILYSLFTVDRKAEKEQYTHAHAHYTNLLFLCGNTQTHVFFFFSKHTETHNSRLYVRMCTHTHTLSRIGHFRGPQISGANAHTQRHTKGTLEAPRSVVHLRQ